MEIFSIWDLTFGPVLKEFRVEIVTWILLEKFNGNVSEI